MGRQDLLWRPVTIFGAQESQKQRCEQGGGEVVRQAAKKQKTKRECASEAQPHAGVVLFTEVRKDMMHEEEESFVAAIDVRCEEGTAEQAAQEVRARFVAFAEGRAAEGPNKSDVMADWLGVRAELCRSVYGCLSYAQNCARSLRLQPQNMRSLVNKADEHCPQKLVDRLLRTSESCSHYAVILAAMKQEWCVRGGSPPVAAYFKIAARVLAQIELGDIESDIDPKRRQCALLRLVERNKKAFSACVDTDIAVGMAQWMEIVRQMLEKLQAYMRIHRQQTATATGAAGKKRGRSGSSGPSDRLRCNPGSCASPVNQLPKVLGVVELD